MRYPWFERRRGKGSPFLERFLLPSQKSFSALSFQREFEQALDEIREGHAFDGGFAGNEAGGGHARRGVDFKDIQSAVILKDEVGAAVALESERVVGAEGGVLHFGGFFGGNGRGTDFLCAVGRVLVVVIEVVALGNDEDSILLLNIILTQAGRH